VDPPEQIVGVVDGAVVGADDVPGADRVVVEVDPLATAGSGSQPMRKSPGSPELAWRNVFSRNKP